MTRKIKHSIIGLVTVLMAVLFGACASPTAKLTVSRSDITAGEAVTVKWETKNAKEITLNGQKVDKIGGQSVSPADTTKFEIVAKRGKKTARDSATVTVAVVKAPEPKVTLTADKSALDLGQATTLRWSTENAKIVTITGLGEVPGSGEREISPRASTTYRTASAAPGGRGSTASAARACGRRSVPRKGQVDLFRLRQIRIAPVGAGQVAHPGRMAQSRAQSLDRFQNRRQL
jgi:hypothetical protein